MDKPRSNCDYEMLSGDVRVNVDTNSGFTMVTLYDADDGDCIVLDEDCIKVLYEKLGRVIQEHKL